MVQINGLACAAFTGSLSVDCGGPSYTDQGALITVLVGNAATSMNFANASGVLLTNANTSNKQIGGTILMIAS